MTTTMKLKTFLYSFFQPNNTYLIQKSMRHADASTKGSSGDDEDYVCKRMKNNESVRRSRAKSRAETQKCAARVDELRKENNDLNSKLDSLQNELFTLKNLFNICFKSENFPIKPNDISTSTLYRLIMKNDANSGSTSLASSQFSTPIASPSLPSSPESFSNDEIYIGKIKNSLSNALNFNSKSSPILNNPITKEHDYSSI